MAEFSVLSIDARHAAGVGLAEEASEARHDSRPSPAAVGTLSAAGCLRVEATLRVPDGLGPVALAAALCSGAMGALAGGMTGRGRLLYRGADGVVLASRLGRLDVDATPVARLVA